MADARTAASEALPFSLTNSVRPSCQVDDKCAKGAATPNLSDSAASGECKAARMRAISAKGMNGF
jgi:hypothetical protein